MERRPERAARVWLAKAVVLGLILFVAGCASNYPQTTLRPRSDITALIDHLFRITFWWAVAVGVLVEGALLFALWKFRARPGAPEPEQTHGNTVVEIIWTAIPAVILVFIAVPTVRTIFATSLPAKDAEIEVDVIGHQWWWEYRYPKLGVVTANELVVPIGKKVGLRMWSADVLHSWWSPQLASKRDVFPVFPGVTKNKKVNPLWFKADSLGDFTGQCAEFCGIQHGRMGLRVMVKPQAEFDQWVAQERIGSPLVNEGKLDPAMDSAWKADTIFSKGVKAFQEGGCQVCHGMSGTILSGSATMNFRGPNLSHVGSRTTIAANMYPNTPSVLRDWLRDPQKMKKGSHMILPHPLSEEDIATLVAYLRAHK